MKVLLHLVPYLGCIVLALAAGMEFDLEGTENGTSQEKYNRLSRDSLLWGPYRSGHYLGIRPRLPHSLLSGLMWFNVDDHSSISQTRHLYEQGDKMGTANWVQYDPRYGGREIIVDEQCHLNLTIDFVKSDNGRNWGVKVHAVPHEGYENVKTSFVWYSGLEAEAQSEDATQEAVQTGFLRLDNVKNENGYSGFISISGYSEDLGPFELVVGDNKKNKHPKMPKLDMSLPDPKLAHHFSLRVPNDNVWRAKDVFMSILQESVKALVEKYGQSGDMVPAFLAYIAKNLRKYEGNLHFVQKVYEGESEFDIVFNEANTPPTEKITTKNIESRIAGALARFNKNFAKYFSVQKEDQQLGKEILSGLLGGLNYAYGDHLVDRETSFAEDDLPVHEDGSVHHPKLNGKPEGPFELFSLVPSRPFFPRGFYWDEGFHLLPLLKYDTDLALEIFKGWFNLIDDDGWVAREQILGPELRSRVPEEFVVQSPEIVNPPTLLLAFTYLLEKGAQEKSIGKANIDVEEGIDISRADLGEIVMNSPQLLANYAKEVYPKLKLHYNRFRSTQIGYVGEFERGVNPEAYRWRGRTDTHSLASGLDDYPRALPMDVAELNVDLLCWIGVMTRSIKMMAELLELQEDVQLYTTIEADISANIEALHWSEEHKIYCDLTVDDDDENLHACFKGYISIFPFVTRFIEPDNVEKLKHIVDFITDPEEVWSDYGIRSMSKSDALYRTGENYWRSPIWININFLVLDSLLYFYVESAPFASHELKEKIAKAYTELRSNLIENVRDQREKTGFVWEQYDDETGQAKGAKNFLGWSSLVLLMMEMPEKLGQLG